jgi:hypothetical protein
MTNIQNLLDNSVKILVAKIELVGLMDCVNSFNPRKNFTGRYCYFPLFIDEEN